MWVWTPSASDAFLSGNTIRGRDAEETESVWKSSAFGFVSKANHGSTATAGQINSVS
jgi:hypothetical protein